uniref:Myelocytomatosis oncogene homolog n=2 Tax=Tetraodon nigroviridis TaxID=99883 RepID=H3CM62_TETNG
MRKPAGLKWRHQFQPFQSHPDMLQNFSQSQNWLFSEPLLFDDDIYGAMSLTDFQSLQSPPCTPTLKAGAPGTNPLSKEDQLSYVSNILLEDQDMQFNWSCDFFQSEGKEKDEPSYPCSPQEDGSEECLWECLAVDKSLEKLVPSPALVRNKHQHLRGNRRLHAGLPEPEHAGAQRTEDEEERRRTHNVMERQRRNELKNCFTRLRDIVPELSHNDKASKVVILKKARDFIYGLEDEGHILESKRNKLRAKQQELKARLERLRC